MNFKHLKRSDQKINFYDTMCIYNVHFIMNSVYMHK